jgi:hypothetical protein
MAKRPKPQKARDAPPGTIWFGGPIDRCSITLRIIGDSVDPVEISRLLGCRSTFCRVKGYPIYGKHGQAGRIAKTGGWHLTLTSDETGEWDVEENIRLLLARVSDDPGVLASLATRFKIELFCGLFMESCNRGLVLSVDTLKALTDRGIELGFDIYYAPRAADSRSE